MVKKKEDQDTERSQSDWNMEKPIFGLLGELLDLLV